MPRVLSVYLPHWAIQRYARKQRLRKGEPVLVVTTRAGRDVVVHASSDALRAGVVQGMTLANARALLRKTPRVAQAEPEKDNAGLVALARLVSRRWTPTVSADAPDGLLCDIAGCEHIFGGEKRLVRSLTRALNKLGLTVRTAAAQTVGTAWALARYSDASHTFVARGHEQEALSPLSVASLRLSESVATHLHEVGVERVAQLLALPRASLPSRYGHEVLLRIDQALGTAFEPVLRTQEEEHFEACFVLDGGTTHLETVELATHAAMRDLCMQLDRCESGLRRLVATYQRLDADAIDIVVQVSKPTRDAKHLWALFRPRLEKLHLGHGVEGVTLRAGLVVRVSHEQNVFHRSALKQADDDAQFAAMLDTIANRIGFERVQKAVLIESHRPERAAKFVCVQASVQASVRTKLSSTRSDVLLPHRPSRLLHECVPLRVTALSPDGPVLRLSIAGSEHEKMRTVSAGSLSTRNVTTCIGPERIGGEWWRAREGTRDYFCVQDEGGTWLWIFRDGASGDWFMHGEWA